MRLDGRRHVLIQPDTHKRAKMRALKEGISLQDLTDRAMLQYLDEMDRFSADYAAIDREAAESTICPECGKNCESCQIGGQTYAVCPGHYEVAI